MVKERVWKRVYRIESTKKQANKCFYCHEPLTYKTATADHVIPHSKNGKTTSENIKASCYACNQAKGILSLNEFKKKIKKPKLVDIDFYLCYLRKRIWTKTHNSTKRLRKTLFKKDK